MKKSDMVRSCHFLIGYMHDNGFDCRASMEKLSDTELEQFRNLLLKIGKKMVPTPHQQCNNKS